MNMQKVEFVKFRNFSHAGSERQIVRRVVEQRIPGDLDLVIVNMRLGLREPDGLSVGNEMDVVSALCQFEAQFRGHHPAASIGGIAGDPDLHRALRDTCRYRWPQNVCDSDFTPGSVRYGLTKCQEGCVYSEDLRSKVSISSGSTWSKCSWRRCLVSAGSPINSTPFPTPGSLVRTTAVVEIFSSFSQKSTRRVVPTFRGRIDST